MNTNHALENSNPNSNPQPADFDDLVALACKGDRRAVGAIAIALGPQLVGTAKRALGKQCAQDAGDVLNDFCVAMLEGIALPPERGRALAWMHGVVRAIARRHRAQWRKQWGLIDDGT